MVTGLRSVRDEEDARELLRRWEASGESMGAWCRKNGVARQSLQWWRGRLPAAGAVVRVAEVVLPRPGPEYRIVLGNGREVVVGAFHPDQLRELLAVVDA
jgi:hypothetical protein